MTDPCSEDLPALVAVAAHRVLNSATIISGFAEMLLADGAGRLVEEDRRAILEIVRDKALSISDVLHDMVRGILPAETAPGGPHPAELPRRTRLSATA